MRDRHGDSLAEIDSLELTDFLLTEEDTYLKRLELSRMIEFLSYSVPLFDAPVVYGGPDIIKDSPLETREAMFLTSKTILENYGKSKIKMYLLSTSSFDEVILEDKGETIEVTFSDNSVEIFEDNDDTLFGRKLISPFGIIPGTENFIKVGTI